MTDAAPPDGLLDILARGSITTTRLARMNMRQPSGFPLPWPLPPQYQYQPVEFGVMPGPMMAPRTAGEDPAGYLYRLFGGPGSGFSFPQETGGLALLIEGLRRVIVDAATERIKAANINPGGPWPTPGELVVGDDVLHALLYGDSLLVEESPPHRKSPVEVFGGVYTKSAALFGGGAALSSIVGLAQTPGQGLMLLAASAGAALVVGSGGVAATALGSRWAQAAADEEQRRI